jgi:hypothetical protein
MHNRRWAHPSVEDAVSRRIDSAVDQVVALCDTNGDGYIDVVDLATVASAAKTLPHVPPCMPGGVPGKITSPGTFLPPAAESFEPGPSLSPRSRAAKSGDTSPPHKWPPPRTHVEHESIGDIVSFLQVRFRSGGVWEVPEIQSHHFALSSAAEHDSSGRHMAPEAQHPPASPCRRPLSAVGLSLCPPAVVRVSKTGGKRAVRCASCSITLICYCVCIRGGERSSIVGVVALR